jgi:hypothetical protein
MSFYKEIELFQEYLHSIRKLKNFLSFDLEFPSKWSMPKNFAEEGQTVPFESEGTNLKGVSFVCEFKETEVNKVLNKILKIIKLNKERELKEKLFKETIEQLKQTFEKTDLDQLQRLYFDFDNDDVNLNDHEQDGQESTTIELAE